MELNLNVRDRLVIISMLPISGSIVEMSEAIDIVKIVKFNKEEMDSIDYSEDNGKVTWNMDKEIETSFTFSFEQVAALKKYVERLDKDKKIDLNNLQTCLKINSL